MAYVRTGGMSTASRRRRRTTALVLAGITIVLLIVLAYAVAYVQGWVGSDEPSGGTDNSQATSTSTVADLEPSDVTVNVYNAKGEPGLAGKIAGELRDLDFTVDDVDNDPEKAQIDHTADIRFGPDGQAAAESLQQLVPESELVPLEREGDAIDLVLGDDFKELAEPEDASQDEATSTS